MAGEGGRRGAADDLGEGFGMREDQLDRRPEGVVGGAGRWGGRRGGRRLGS